MSVYGFVFRRSWRAAIALGFAGAVTALGCAGEATGPAESPSGAGTGSAVGAASAAPEALPAIEFVEDDVEAAAARAKAEGKALFVDVWAPWCHTCLSMKSYVLNEPALRPLASRVVFAAIDSDRPSSARFLESHKVNVWPTFFVIDPTNDVVAGAWPGSASLSEMRAFIEDGVATIDAMRAGTLAEGSPLRLVAEARAAQAGGDPAKAAALFERAAGGLAADHPRRSEVRMGWIFALYAAKEPARCAEVGRAHVAEVKGAAVPADFSSFLIACAEKLPDAEKGPAMAAAIERLRQVTGSPSPEAAADDRADAWGILAEALEATGDEKGARAALETKLSILEKAAAAAPSPEVAATYDYARAGTYVALGQGEKAIAMLEERERQMPGSYEPPARLSGVLFKMGRSAEAKAAIDRAIGKAYGPRKLGYLRLRASIAEKLGDTAGVVATLREEVQGWEALPAGQKNAAGLADAQKRLEAAEASEKAGAGKAKAVRAP
ncbi:MAG: thioredoxin family protein [Polyangiaceae bacterium]